MIEDNQRCRVYWGSHGCKLTRDHIGAHLCRCDEHAEQDEKDGVLNVGASPYYGEHTLFYGEDS